MKISKTSWHYRLLKWFTAERDLLDGELKPRSLCSYVTELMALVMFGIPTISITAVVLSPALLIDWFERKYPRAKPMPPKEPKTLLGKWLKAKKDKVCPLIERE